LATALFAAFCGMCVARTASADDQLIETAHNSGGQVIPYILTATSSASVETIVILMPGGNGSLKPRMKDGTLVFDDAQNFLIRSRGLFADSRTVAVSIDATSDTDTIQAISSDCLQRFPGAKIYVIGTSRSTYLAMELADKLDGQVAGFVYTSSMDDIEGFDTRNRKSRQLLVHHRQDGCEVTPYSSAWQNHEKYGTTLITMEGGISVGKDCKAMAHHGYNGIEKETVERIKEWIAQDDN
jgi:hypothetical protein